MSRLRLRIGPVIQNAMDVKARAERDLRHHSGLIRLAEGVAAAARDAEKAAQRLRRPFGVHRLPAAFLALALLLLFVWTYRQFFQSTLLKVAVPDRDAQALRTKISHDGMAFEPVTVLGSREAADLVSHGKVDLAFVQGGIDIDPSLRRLETPNPEIVLWFIRSTITDLGEIRRVLTSVQGAGSHTVALSFMKAWKLDSQVKFVHEWKQLSDEKTDYVVPDDIDAVFAVKDPSDDKTLRASERLADLGFRLASPDLGARLSHLEYLHPHVIPAGFLRSVPPYPKEPVSTYSVSTYLVARPRMTYRMLTSASHLLDDQPRSMSDVREPTLSETSELFQGIDAFLGIIINLVLAFLALTGLEMMAYRKRFHELNSLVSLISIHQSSKDVLAVGDVRVRKDHLLYLSLSSDLLGLISMIAGYYTQENSSLLFSGLPEIIHQRCDGLKINIQLKILHALIKTDSREPESPALIVSPNAAAASNTDPPVSETPVAPQANAGIANDN